MKKLSEQSKRICHALRLPPTLPYVYKYFGVSRQSVYEWNDKGYPIKRLVEIADKTGKSIEWLQSGDEPYSKPSYTESDMVADRSQVYQSLNKIPVYGPVKAGGLIEISDEPIDYVEFNVMFKPHWKLMKVDGDSMYPRFKQGEAIWVDWAVDQFSLRDGSPYVVCIPGSGATLKYVFFLTDRIRLEPENKKYPAEELTATELQDRGIKFGAVKLRIESFE